MLGLDFIFFLITCFYCFVSNFSTKKKKKKKKLRRKDSGCSLPVFQLSHVFLSDILGHCALIESDYI
jgi:hypothetical protein